MSPLQYVARSVSDRGMAHAVALPYDEHEDSHKRALCGYRPSYYGDGWACGPWEFVNCRMCLVALRHVRRPAAAGEPAAGHQLTLEL